MEEVVFLHLQILSTTYIKTTMRYAHPNPENKRKAVEVLAAVFGGESKSIADSRIQERESIVISMSGN